MEKEKKKKKDKPSLKFAHFKALDLSRTSFGIITSFSIFLKLLSFGSPLKQQQMNKQNQNKSRILLKFLPNPTGPPDILEVGSGASSFFSIIKKLEKNPEDKEKN